jgi:hypothetical protein
LDEVLRAGEGVLPDLKRRQAELEEELKRENGEVEAVKGDQEGLADLRVAMAEQG